jgi:hypothetical protein
MAREQCGLLAGPRTVPVSWQSYQCPSLGVWCHITASATQSLLMRAENCIAAGGGHFEQLL